MVDPNNNYTHSAEESNSVYDDIFKQYACGKASVLFPKLEILAGQPGAGKTTILELITKSFSPEEQPVIVSIDDLRDFHLFAGVIFNQHPFEFALYTNEEAWTWTSRLLTEARQTKNNVVYETTLRVASPIEVIINAFQTAGYSADLNALAVNSKERVQGIYKRYETQIRFKEAPRWTPIIEFHDGTYRDFPDNVAYLEAHANLEKVSVYRRDGMILYESTNPEALKGGAKQIIINERTRAWTPEEKTRFVNTWDGVFELINEGPETRPDWYIENARRLRREAELFASSEQAKIGQRPHLSQIEEVTHHHIFTRRRSGDELVCYDIGLVDVANLPVRNLRLLPQPQEHQPS